MVKTAVPAQLRQQVERWANAWLTGKFSRLIELRARDPGPFNYPIEVFAEWRAKAFYLNVRYRAHNRKVDDDFVVRHTRMTPTASAGSTWRTSGTRASGSRSTVV